MTLLTGHSWNTLVLFTSQYLPHWTLSSLGMRAVSNSSMHSKCPSGLDLEQMLFYFSRYQGGPPWLLSGKESTRQSRRHGFNRWVGKIPFTQVAMPSSRGKGQTTPVFLPGKSHGQRSLVGYSPWDCKELDTTKHARLSNWTELNWTEACTHAGTKSLPCANHFSGCWDWVIQQSSWYTASAC